MALLFDGNGFLKTDPWKLSVAENETIVRPAKQSKMLLLAMDSSNA